MGGVNPILPMLAFWVHMDPQPIPNKLQKLEDALRGQGRQGGKKGTRDTEDTGGKGDTGMTGLTTKCF